MDEQKRAYRREYMRRYRAEHPVTLSDEQRAKLRENHRAWYAANAERVREKQRLRTVQWQRDHPEQVKAAQHRYYQRHLGAERAARRAEREARKRAQQAQREQRSEQRTMQDQRVIEMRASGATWRAIAQALGYKSESGALRAWQSAMMRKHWAA